MIYGLQGLILVCNRETFLLLNNRGLKYQILELSVTLHLPKEINETCFRHVCLLSAALTVRCGEAV